MKKKQVKSLRKLSFEKTAIATLNTESIKGGQTCASGCTTLDTLFIDCKKVLQ